VKQVVKPVVVVPVSFPLSSEEARDPVMRKSLTDGMADSLGVEKDMVAIDAIGGLPVARHRRLTGDLEITFKIEAQSHADTAKLAATIEKAAISGHIVANVQEQAASNGVLTPSMKAMLRALPKPVTKEETVIVTVTVVEVVTAAPTPAPSPAPPTLSPTYPMKVSIANNITASPLTPGAGGANVVLLITGVVGAAVVALGLLLFKFSCGKGGKGRGGKDSCGKGMVIPMKASNAPSSHKSTPDLETGAASSSCGFNQDEVLHTHPPALRCGHS
jgi:hypothetical protein